MFIHPTPCNVASEMEMDFFVFFDAYPMAARISGALLAKGASMKLT